ncbi:hypothetical protein [Flavobacterium columnare]|uniref:Lipoprotein n=1 Tax=Flavobacterium columnare TaxID=996 RepID=A0AAI8CDW9_9FLAO|nr:hypothetical protein [Flavobacterium columnare]AMO19242.1 hypothetical protein UN65_01700 [Flavobacterium columnare]AUX17177.1 hypothetical protein AQ623_01765 [Flavobacterium columnare]QOG56191.1 hypothetical protein HUE29_01710 [Flavobacterium columnare]QOG58914.1 hypothetical protein HUE30_01710 [Flavobacterium columnare]QOG61636.1 hypothetical protein HUE31_01715 [Flavobacterium columnare]
MKLVKYIVVFLLVFGCKTKTVTVDKSIEKERELMSRRFDSLFQSLLKWQLEASKTKSAMTNDFKLSSAPVQDSLGRREPFHYKHYVDGQLKEEIFLKGGDINKETKSSKTDEAEKRQENKQEKTNIESNARQKKEAKKGNFKKQKNAKVAGFQFGFYLWLLLLIIILLILRWLSNKFKLGDRFKSVLKPKEG